MHDPSDTPADIDQLLIDCANEPIHIPGAIQPHGLLIVIDADTLRITQASSNSEAFTGKPADALPGTSLNDLLEVNAYASIVSWLQKDVGAVACLYQKPVSLIHEQPQSTPQYHLIAHQLREGYVLEFEPVLEESPLSSNTNTMLETAIERLQKCPSLQALYECAVREIKALTGLARVKCYRFDKEWHGSVVAEARDEFMPSYLGLHFPASDIPEQARKLYMLNRTRLISAVAYEPARLVPALNPRTGKPLDLTQSSLRSVSPVHLEYLANMGVQASMSISIIHEETLWGLFTCHHHNPVYISYPARMICTILGQVVSMLIENHTIKREEKSSVALKKVQNQLLKYMIREKSFMHGLTGFSPNLMQVTHAAGAALVRDTAISLLGKTPSEAQIRELCEWFNQENRDKLFHTDRLSELFAPAKAYQDTASGVIAYSLSRIQGIYVLWFKPEEPEVITWAGDPRKSVGRETQGRTLHPTLLRPGKS